MGACVTKDSDDKTRVAKANEKKPEPNPSRAYRRLTIAGHENEQAAAIAAALYDKEPVPPSDSPRGDAKQNGAALVELEVPSPETVEGDHELQEITVTWTVGSYSIPGYEPMNPFKQNQDIFCMLDNFGQDPKQAFFGVFDGHGFAGKEASHYVKDKLPATIDKDRAILRTQPEKALSAAFVKTNKALRSSKVDVTYSGTTAVTTFLQGSKLYTCNTGDSRAVLGAQEPDGVFKAYDLSDDHKPDRQDEYERIINCKGRVEPVRDFSDETYGPNRVWLKEENLPGLAMSRSFGDAVAHSVGVIADPEISVKVLHPRDKFMVLASDGVWEFVTSQDAVDVVSKFSLPQEAAEALARESYRRWQVEGEGVADDTSCVVVFFNVKGNPSAQHTGPEFRRVIHTGKK